MSCNAAWFKPHGDRCYCWYDNCGCVTPRSVLNCYCQLCILHCFMCHSMDHVQKASKIAPAVITRDAEKDMNKVTPCRYLSVVTAVHHISLVFSAFCCTVSSCFCQFPQCLGSSAKSECLCCAEDIICCKPQCCDSNRQDQDACCVLQKGACWLQMPTTCCKGIFQNCCLDTRTAFPCDNDVPCLWTALPFCTCCVNFGCKCMCCATIEQMTGKSAGGNAGGVNVGNSRK